MAAMDDLPGIEVCMPGMPAPELSATTFVPFKSAIQCAARCATPSNPPAVTEPPEPAPTCTFVDTFTNDTGATVDLSDHIADTGQAWVHVGGLTSRHSIQGAGSYINALTTEITQGATTKVDAPLPVPLTFSFTARHVLNLLGVFDIRFIFGWDGASSAEDPDNGLTVKLINQSDSASTFVQVFYRYGGTNQNIGTGFFIYDEAEPYNFQITGSLSDDLIEVTFTPTVGDPVTLSEAPEAPFAHDSFCIASISIAESDALVIVDDLNICSVIE